MLIMKRFFLLFLLLFWFISSKAQNEDSVLLNAYRSVKGEDLKTIVYALSSPKMEGRGVGTEGIQKASNYISKCFQGNSIGYISALNGYEQKIDYTQHRLNKPIVSIGKVNCTEFKDYIGATSTISKNRALGIIIVKNTSLDYIKGLELKNKVILILTSDIFFVKKPLYDVLLKKGCNGVILCNPNNKN